MQFSPQQDRALKQVADWHAGGQDTPQVFRLFGYAGTGKTTLARHLAEGIDGDVLFGAFTGKAAHVLRTKGCSNASTIHSMIYRSQEKGTRYLKDMEAELAALIVQMQGAYVTPAMHKNLRDLEAKVKLERENVSRPLFKLNFDSAVKDASLVIIDECSMVDADMGADLLSFGTKVLVLGDPAQLPPIGGAGYFTEGVAPDIMLTEIHRQAEDNPIIRLATDVRLERRLALGTYGESRVLNMQGLNAEFVLGHNQLIVGRNKTRFLYNRRLRELNGRHDPLPVPGDKLVCLRNDHDAGLLNGAIWTTIKSSLSGEDLLTMTIQPESDDVELECEAHAHYFLGKGDKLPWYEKKLAQEFDYGYALTCHKSQGSQWDSVLVVDESGCFRQDRHKWLYTAITRAAEKVSIAI